MSSQNEDKNEESGVFIHIAMIIVAVAVIFVGRSHDDGFTTPDDDEIAEAVFISR